MDFLAALDILLALSLIYLVFALMVTAMNESIAAALSSRARWLRRGIASLLSTNPKALDEAAADKVLDSPFVTFLGTPGRFKTFRPSYIPAWTLMQGCCRRWPATGTTPSPGSPTSARWPSSSPTSRRSAAC
jgi:hypothetical protein